MSRSTSNRAGTRKGFTYEIRSAIIDKSDERSYEEFEDFSLASGYAISSTTLRPGAHVSDKRKFEQYPDIIGYGFEGSKRSRDDPLAMYKPRFKMSIPMRYPIICYRSMLKFDDSLIDKEKLNAILGEVCETELNGLDDYFSHHHVGGPKIDAIWSTLQSVISRLALEVSQLCPQDAVFLPEVSNAEMNENSKLLKLLQSLEDQSQNLAIYEDDIIKFAKENDVWVDHAPVDHLISAEPDTTETYLSDDDNMNLIASRFEKNLEQMEVSSTKILGEMDTIKEAVTSSRKAQGDVYKSFQDVLKLSEPATTAAAKIITKPQEILRHLQLL